MFLRPLFLLPFLSILSLFCAPRHSLTPPPLSPPASTSLLGSSCDVRGSHSVFSIFVDGADIGREVRTDLIEHGDNGSERFFISHLVKNKKMGKFLFQSVQVRTERTVADTGALLNASFTKRDHVSIETVSVHRSDGAYHRSIEINSPYKSMKKRDVAESVALSDNDIIGFRIIDACREAAMSPSPSAVEFSYFDANLAGSTRLRLSSPRRDSIIVDGQSIEGAWVDVSERDNDDVIASYFFDSAGLLWSEHFPEFYETRVRLVGSFSLPEETSELLVGLHSNTYIYDPNVASRATYHLTSTPDRLDRLQMLDEPLNQTVKRLSPEKLELTVHAGAPDLTDPPIDSDLGTSFYIRPDDPLIKDALLFLRSGGKKGALPEKRRLNATSVVASATMIEKPRSFWSDNDSVASLLMQFVYSLLPDKRHTFSMSDALETLLSGRGDCTEHAVLFASLMRSHGIPTRLIAGMLLTPGGTWSYHMWCAYWDGEMWRAIDPSTKTFRPGALYVSLGRGASLFKDVRDKLADFMWRTFSGVSFDLVDASNEGESLFLARPLGLGSDLGETALFNAVVLSDRGDHLGALSLIDANIPESGRSLSVNLMRVDLLFNAGRYDLVLDNVSSLRKETSSSDNVSLLDRFELYSLLHLRRYQDAETVLSSVMSSDFLGDDQKLLHEMSFLFFSGRAAEAISSIDSLISEGSLSDASRQDFVSKYAFFVSLYDDAGEDLLSSAYAASLQSVRNSSFVDSDSLLVLSRILHRLNRPTLASWYIDHALTLSPKDQSLQDLRRVVSDASRCDAN